MQTLIRRTGWFALFCALTVPLFPAPVQAQSEDRARQLQEIYGGFQNRERQFRGVWTMTRPVYDNGSDGELRYRLALRNDGQAIMTVERVGLIQRSNALDEMLGSMLYSYLRREKRVIHTGTWTADRDGDEITINLTDIAGRRDVARFSGRSEGRRLRLTTSNPGMYGRGSRFTFRQDTDSSPYGRRNDDQDRWGNRNDRSDRDSRWGRDDRTPSDRDDYNDDYEDRRNRNRGSVVWQGRVDSGVLLYIRDTTVRTEPINGAVYNTRSQFNGTMPTRPTRVSVTLDRGRGEVTIVEQPSSSNNYTAAIRVLDPQSGRDDYRITVSWE